jgi:chromosome segregation ATPase
LDIVNIERLLKLIHRGLDGIILNNSANNMQFIVVSHKELVFSTCHSLVGAINQNKTSRAFSLRLDE